jgi:hypothetical protein
LILAWKLIFNAKIRLDWLMGGLVTAALLGGLLLFQIQVIFGVDVVVRRITTDTGLNLLRGVTVAILAGSVLLQQLRPSRKNASLVRLLSFAAGLQLLSECTMATASAASAASAPSGLSIAADILKTASHAVTFIMFSLIRRQNSTAIGFSKSSRSFRSVVLESALDSIMILNAEVCVSAAWCLMFRPLTHSRTKSST